MTGEYNIQHLTADDVEFMRSLLGIFGDAFNEIETYRNQQPSTSYLKQLLSKDHFIALVALKSNDVVGGLAAYELHKFEQERSEIYIYDLAIKRAHRRKGVATALIRALKEIAIIRGVWVIFVQADYSDAPAIALYEKLGMREEVLHFDIPVRE